MLWDEPKIFFLERRYFFSIILSEFLKNRVALHRGAREYRYPSRYRLDFLRTANGWKAVRIATL